MKYLGFIDLDRDKYNIVGQFDSLLLIYRSSFSKQYIEAIGPDFKNVLKTELEIPKGHFHFFRIINERNSFSIVYCLQNKGKIELRIKKLNAAVTELYDTLVLSYPDQVHIADIEIVLSENRKQMLIYHLQNDNTVSWTTFDLENLIVSKQKYLNEEDLSLKLEDVLVSDAANVFFLIAVNSRYRRRHNHIKLKSYTAEGKNYENTCFLSAIYLESVKFKYDEVNQRISGAALYSDKGYGAKGIMSFIAVVPDTFTFKQIPFNDTLLTNMKGGKNKRNNGVEHLKINEMILRRDGGFITICEQFVRYEYQMPSNFRNDFPTNRQVEFYYDNILVSSIHPDGKAYWNVVLYKNQKSENDEGSFSSYFLMKNPRGLKFIFNDEINWKSAVYEYELMPDGGQQRRRIFPDNAIEEKDILPEFRKAIQISANKLIFVQQKYNKLHFGAISY